MFFYLKFNLGYFNKDRKSVELISKNKVSFRAGALYALEKYSGVGIIRISQLEVSIRLIRRIFIRVYSIFLI